MQGDGDGFCIDVLHDVTTCVEGERNNSIATTLHSAIGRYRY